MLEEIPDKTYFKIGEVAALVQLKTSVLRYWETEFSFLSPEKSSTGQRLYTRSQIETIQQIKQLLYHEKYTIEGVRKKLSPSRKSPPMQQLSLLQSASVEPQELLKQIKLDLQALRASLEA